MIQVPAVIERCAGIDIGKREIAVAVITGPADEDGEIKTKAFQTTVPALEQLREWLIEEGCSSVAMESTGSYWIPVKNILGHLAEEKNRIQKILETANVKIGNIVSDVFGVSGQAMVSVLLRDEELTAEQIADLSKRRLRQRIPELTEAL